jgi:hypothetical protein
MASFTFSDADEGAASINAAAPLRKNRKAKIESSRRKAILAMSL